MSKVVPLHQPDSLTMPLANGATLSVTPFRESPRVALTLFGPSGGNAGGFILNVSRARVLASWLLKIADETEGAQRPRSGPRVVPLR